MLAQQVPLPMKLSPQPRILQIPLKALKRIRQRSKPALRVIVSQDFDGQRRSRSRKQLLPKTQVGKSSTERRQKCPMRREGQPFEGRKKLLETFEHGRINHPVFYLKGYFPPMEKISRSCAQNLLRRNQGTVMGKSVECEMRDRRELSLCQVLSSLPVYVAQPQSTLCSCASTALLLAKCIYELSGSS